MPKKIIFISYLAIISYGLASFADESRWMNCREVGIMDGGQALSFRPDGSGQIHMYTSQNSFSGPRNVKDLGEVRLKSDGSDAAKCKIQVISSAQGQSSFSLTFSEGSLNSGRVDKENTPELACYIGADLIKSVCSTYKIKEKPSAPPSPTGRRIWDEKKDTQTVN